MSINANDYKSNSKSINAEKLKNNPALQVPLIIVDVKEEKLNDKNKLSLKFGGIEDTLVLNQTNLDVMIKAKGADAVKWITATVSLTLIPSKYNGQPVQSVYISKVV
jgi:hypothetical protein